MKNYNFNVENIRFHQLKDNVLIIVGWFKENNPDNSKIEVYLDHKLLSITLSACKGPEVAAKYIKHNAGISEEICVEVELPSDWSNYNNLKIVSVCEGVKTESDQYSTNDLEKVKQPIESYIETRQFEKDKLIITGWAVSKNPVKFEGYMGSKKVELECERSFRRDVSKKFPELKDVNAGFTIICKNPKSKKIELRLSDDVNAYKKTINITKQKWKPQKNFCSIPERLKNFYSIPERLLMSYRRNGLKRTIKKVIIKLKRIKPNNKLNYSAWLKKNKIKSKELENQINYTFNYEPKFSIITPIYRTPEKYLKEFISSIINQTYKNWELCLADGSEEGYYREDIVNEVTRDLPEGKIVYKKLLKNQGISENTNEAIKISNGEFILFADHDDVIAPNALYELAQTINKDETIDVIYTDEDKIDMSGKERFDPRFKPDLNIDLLRSMNYICHLFVVKKYIVEKIGLLNNEYDGAQDYDFILRCIEVANNVYHIPKILYHWRSHRNSTAQNPEAKLYAFENGKKALNEHYRRTAIPAKADHGEFYGLYKTIYNWEVSPLLSIVIPNKDHINDLNKCINSIESKSIYKKYEFIIVENNSTDKETFDYYKSIENRDNVTIVNYDGEFNYSKINNYGVQFAKGEYILLLNNDTELKKENSIREMLDYCMRDDVGIVGAKLLYKDNTIQHAGVVMGFGGIAGHTFIGEHEDNTGYMSRIICAQNYSAVTAACLMTKKELYMQVGGLSEEFKIAFNDIDYCLKIRELGKLVVYNPEAVFYHYESKSRGLEDSPEKIERFNNEAQLLFERWETIIKKDPYYNPNLSLDRSDFSLEIN